MYELNRIRLVSIGPRGARYGDVTLDLSGQGETVAATSLFDTSSRRPSPYSLLMLENGGGKSVLLKLLFSVVLPGRRKTIGGSALDKFVLDGDTGHVALEWMHVVSGQRLVTAKAYQRRASTKSNTNPLAEAWYSFRPSTTLDLQTLPVADEDRRRRLDGYKQAVDEANRLDATTQLVWLGEDQKGWREHLRAQDIEPDLFDLQRSMNVDEGEAANAFKFGSSQQFVDWLLKTVTDPADAVSVAETFEQWAINLADRDSMLLERDFLEGAVVELEALSEQHMTHADDKKQADSAARRARRLAAALEARRASEEASATQLRGELGEARRTVVGRETERDAATAVANEVRRQTIGIELRDTDEAKDLVRTDLNATTLELAGWEAATLVQGRTTAEANAKAYADEVAAATEQAAPALSRRDSAAGDLLAKYQSEADTADRTAQQHLDDAAADDVEAAAQNTARDDALTVRSTALEKRRSAHETVAQAQTNLHSATTAGLISEGITAGAIPALVTAAAQQRDSLREETAAAAAELAALNATVRSTENAAAAGAKRVSDLAGKTRDAQRTLEDVETVAARIGALTAVTTVSGHDVSDGPLSVTVVDDSADRILNALEVDIDAHTTSLDEHRAAQKEDQRILDALGDGHLLPARRDVERSLLVMTEAGLAAMPGWRYLAESAAADERNALIRAHPDLADGIVLTDPSQMTRARDLLSAAQLLPSAAVAVGTGWALLRPQDPDPDQFVIDPNPALYDEDAAAERREELRSQMSVRHDAMTTIIAQLGDVRDAHSQLSVWRRQNPPGKLTSLRDRLLAAETTEATTRLEIDGLQAQLIDHVEERDTSDMTLEGLRNQERSASDRHRDLELLGAKVAAASDAAASINGLVRDVEDAERAAGRAERLRNQAQERARTHTRQAAEATSLAGRLRDATGDIQSSTGQPSLTERAQSVAELRARYDAEQAAYLAAAVDENLRIKAEDAAAKANAVRREVGLRDRSHVAEAVRLLATPAGSDRTAWTQAVAAARQQRANLSKRHEELTLRVGALTADFDNAGSTGPSKQWVALSEDWQPASVEHGRELHTEARSRQRAAQELVEQANARVGMLEEQRASAESSTGSFREAARELGAALDTVPDAPHEFDPVQPFDESPAAAAQQAERARADIRGTRSAEARSKADLDAASSDLVNFANQTRFEAMTNSVRRSIVESGAATVADRAQDWASLCTGRLASLTTDIETANRHRKTIVDRLTALVDQALRTLRRAAKLSRLPDSLGDWAGKEFLHIAFSDADPATIAHRVGDVVDEFAAAHAARQVGSRTTAPKRDGLSLLLEAVHAAVPRGFRVDVLKPDSVLRDERVSIEEMNDVFSGGQELTAAIVLYCTLAALKADDRGKMRAKHSGVLFLDNPIGRASASYLLDLQQGIASALGVQLIYTTGLSDDRVLAAFPMWVRMRNDADLRAGLKYIRVADQVRRHLPEPFGDDVLADTGTGPDLPGTVTATRVHRRPTPVPARPGS